MTIWIIPESDREGRVVCQIWLQGGRHNETPTDKRTRPDESPLGDLYTQQLKWSFLTQLIISSQLNSY